MKIDFILIILRYDLFHTMFKGELFMCGIVSALAVLFASIAGLSICVPAYYSIDTNIYYATCNVTLCLSYERFCERTDWCYYRTRQIALTLNNTVYTANYTENSDTPFTPCPTGDTTCYYDPNNVLPTLTLAPFDESTLNTYNTFIIISAIGLSLGFIVAVTLIAAYYYYERPGHGFAL